MFAGLGMRFCPLGRIAREPVFFLSVWISNLLMKASALGQVLRVGSCLCLFPAVAPFLSDSGIFRSRFFGPCVPTLCCFSESCFLDRRFSLALAGFEDFPVVLDNLHPFSSREGDKRVPDCVPFPLRWGTPIGLFESEAYSVLCPPCTCAVFLHLVCSAFG